MAALLYAFGPAEQTVDAEIYLYSAETGTDLWNPHHLLFNGVLRAAYLTARSLGIPARAFHVGRAGCALGTAAAIGLFFCILRQLAVSRAGAALGAAFLGFSPVWIRYGAVIENYQATAALTLAGVLLWLRALSRGSLWLYAFSGAIIGFSGLFHQTAFFAGLAFFIATLTIPGTGGQRPRNAMVFAAAGSGIVILAYALTSVALGRTSLKAFFYWLTMYKQEGGAWGKLEYFSWMGFQRLSQSFCEAMIPWTLRPGRARILLAAACFSSILPCAKAGNRDTRAAALAFALWALLYWAFALWWTPWEWEFSIIPLVPLVLLWTRALDGAIARLRSSRWKSAAAGFLFLAVASFAWPSWRRNSLAHRDICNHNRIRYGLNLEDIRRAHDGGLVIGDDTERNALFLYSSLPPILCPADMYHASGRRRVQEVYSSGKSIILSGFCPTCGVMGYGKKANIPAMDFLLSALVQAHPSFDPNGAKASAGLLPDFQPVEGMGRRDRALIFSPKAPLIPAREFYKKLLASVMAFIPGSTQNEIQYIYDRLLGMTAEELHADIENRRSSVEKLTRTLEFSPAPAGQAQKGGVREWKVVKPPLQLIQPIHLETPWAYRILRVELRSEKNVRGAIVYYSTDFFPMCEITKLNPSVIQYDPASGAALIDFSLDDLFWKTAGKITMLRLDINAAPGRAISDVKISLRTLAR